MCPVGLQWYGDVNKCYSSHVRKSVLGEDIAEVCKALHPKAVPVEPRNQAENDIIVNMIGKVATNKYRVLNCILGQGHFTLD